MSNLHQASAIKIESLAYKIEDGHASGFYRRGIVRHGTLLRTTGNT